jgi:hypothetical protein
MLAAPEESPNSGRDRGEQLWAGHAAEKKARSEERRRYAKQNGAQLGFSSPERHNRQAALDSAHSPYDYQESVRGSVSSSVATDANDVGDSLDISTSLSSYTKQNRSDSSSAAGSDADSIVRRHRSADVSEGYALTDQSWNPELDGAEALSAVAQFNQAIARRKGAPDDSDDPGSAYISGDDWQRTVAKQMRMHREMILNGRMTGTAQAEMGSDSEDEAYDENEDAFLIPQWAQQLQLQQQEHEMLHESAARDAFDSDMSSVRSSNDSIQSATGASRSISRRQRKEVYESAMECIKLALHSTLNSIRGRHNQRDSDQAGVVLTRKSLMRISNLVLREMKKATQDAAAITASLSSSMGSGFLKQWAGPVSLSNMRSPLSLGGKDAPGIFVLDMHIKSTLRNLLLRYEGRVLVVDDVSASMPSSSNQCVLSAEIVQDVMDLLYEESTWTKLATEVEDSYRQDVEVMHASWQKRLKSYGRIGQLGARHAAWERDREKLTSRMGGLKQARDRDMKLLNAERCKRLEKSVQSNTEAGESGDEESGDNDGGFDPLDFQRAQNAYVADEFEGTSETSGLDAWSLTNNVSSATSTMDSVFDEDFDNNGYSAEEEESEVEIDADSNNRIHSSRLAVARVGPSRKRRPKKGKRRKKKSAASAAAGVYGAPMSRKVKRKQKSSAKAKRGRSASPADKKKASPTASRKLDNRSPGRDQRELSPRSLTRMSRGDNLERSPQAAAFAAGMEMAAKNVSSKGGQQSGIVGPRIGVNVPSVSGEPIFSEEETRKYARSYSDAIAAAGSAVDISRQIESSLRNVNDTTGQLKSPGRKTKSTTVPQVAFSYDGKLRELFQRARRSGVDWSAMFAVTDADAVGRIRERDFRDAMSHIASADVRFEGLQPDEMVHVLRRFSSVKSETHVKDSSAVASSGWVDYKKFVQFYTDDSNHTDEGGFVSIGELPVDADVFDDSVGLEAFADKLAREAEAFAGDESKSHNGKNKLMTPAEYHQRRGGGSGSSSEGHDQTSRLNQQLASAMLRKMGNPSPSRSQHREIDPAVMTQEEIESLTNTVTS